MSDVDGPQPGWHPDPHGRHQLRWWDGRTWTDQVADGGVQGTDGVGAPPQPAATVDVASGPAAAVPAAGPTPGRRRWPWVVVAVVAVLAVVGASLVLLGGDDDEAAAADPFVAVLEGLPAGGDYGETVYLTDLDAADAQLGLERPAVGASDDELRDYLVGLQAIDEGDGAWVLQSVEPFTGLVRDTGSTLDEELGWDLPAVRAMGSTGELPDTLSSIVGDFDVDRIDATIHGEPIWSDALDAASHDGRDYWQWESPDESFDAERITTARPLGAPSRMYVDGGRILWARSTEPLEDGLDALDDGDSLADDEGFRSVAVALHEAGAHTAVLHDRGYLPGSADEACAVLGGEPSEECTDSVLALRGVDVMGYGWGRGPSGDPVAALVFWTGSEADAGETADELSRGVGGIRSLVTEQLVSEWFDIAEVTHDGRLVVATLDTDRPRALLDADFRRDRFFYVD